MEIGSIDTKLSEINFELSFVMAEKQLEHDETMRRQLEALGEEHEADVVWYSI